MKKELQIKAVIRNPKREKELQAKIMALSTQYSDVPMLFMNNLRLTWYGEMVIHFMDKNICFVITRNIFSQRKGKRRYGSS
jgi:hypothetical protein